MAKYIHDFRVGDDYSLKLTCNDSTGTAIDITDYKFWITLKSSFDDLDSEAVLQFVTTVGDNADDDPLNGIAHIYVPNGITKSIPSGKYFYEVQQKTASGAIKTIVPPVEDYKDKVFVAPELTRAVA
jgi:hypothetical protein